MTTTHGDGQNPAAPTYGTGGQPGPPVPNAARVYDWLLGGKDNYDADRQAGRRLERAVPGARQAAVDNREFLARAVAFLAARGITQFIDIGSGLPAARPVHEVARETFPDARVAYVDHDPVVIAHARALLAGGDGLSAALADLRHPAALMTDAGVLDVIDTGRPVGLLLVAVLHFIASEQDPYGLVREITRRLAPGSWLVISHVTADQIDPAAARAARAAYAGADVPAVPRTRSLILRTCTGPTAAGSLGPTKIVWQEVLAPPGSVVGSEGKAAARQDVRAPSPHMVGPKELAGGETGPFRPAAVGPRRPAINTQPGPRVPSRPGAHRPGGMRRAGLAAAPRPPPHPRAVLGRRRPHPRPGGRPVTPATAPAGTGTATAVGMLEALGTELGALGLAARLRIQAGEVPVLHVTSPAGPALAEDIRAACQDRAWLFWWSWGEPVPAGTVPAAAALISRVLAAP